MKAIFAVLLVIGFAGCSVQYLDPDKAPQSKAAPKPVDSLPPAPAELSRLVKDAFGGNKAAAADFYGLYSAAADASTDDKYATKSTELMDGLESARGLLSHQHGEFPKLVEVVKNQLGSLATPEPLTTDKRKSWRDALQQLAAACRAAAT